MVEWRKHSESGSGRVEWSVDHDPRIRPADLGDICRQSLPVPAAGHFPANRTVAELRDFKLGDGPRSLPDVGAEAIPGHQQLRLSAGLHGWDVGEEHIRGARNG